MKTWISILILFPIIAFAKCDIYYFSLDFGGAIGDGAAIVDYLGKEDIPFTLFLVGKNSVTPGGQKVCEGIRRSQNKKISIGNHTITHEGFGRQHTEAHIRQEIIGNESFMNQCDPKRVIKYFRYPKGSAHPLAEKILTEAGYLGTYEKFFPQSDAVPTKAVWWTTDTRDWVKPTGASAWAQIDYYNKNGKLLSVDEDSWRDLVATIGKANSKDVFNQKMTAYLNENGNEYPTFETMENVPGYHGPTDEDIAKNILNDEGKKGLDGKKHCFPLMHYGGINSYAAFKKFIPALKANKVTFRGLGDGDTVNHQLSNVISDFNSVNKEVEIKCPVVPDSFKYTVVAGDNIFSIARSMINTNKTTCPTSEKSPVSALVKKILALNKISETTEINAGMVLNIPTNCLYVK